MPDDTMSAAGGGPARDERPAAKVPVQGDGERAGADVGQLLTAGAPAATGPAATGSGATGPGTGRPLAARARAAPGRLGAVAGWTAAAIVIAGVAWMLTAVITYWTTYPVLTMQGWQTLTYGARSAQVSFQVHNSGTGEAEKCVAYLRLGSHQLIARKAPAVPAHGIGGFFITYRLRPGWHPRLAYAWATCGAARTARQAVPDVTAVSLVAGHPRLAARGGLTTARFQVHNLGSQLAIGCRAFLRLSTAVVVDGTALQPDLPGHAAAAFSVRYDPAAHTGTPAAAWAQCTDPAAGRGHVSSSRAYLRPRAR
jgi:hypothetical protein